MEPLLNIAISAARRAGGIIFRNMNRVDSLKVSSKGRNDFVSEVDRQAEREIIASIKKAYPDHAFLAEESGRQGDSEYLWIIDPLDGTTNYLHGYPVFSVSIAVARGDNLEHAVVYDPLRQELFTASRGSGAQLEGRRIRVSDRRQLDGSLIGTGFPFRGDMAVVDRYMPVLRAVIAEAAGVRRPGSAALDLAYVAAGRLDGFWESGLKPWDIAAGCLLIQEAGGIVSDFQGGDGYSKSGEIIAGTPKVHAALRQVIEDQAETSAAG
jgi:myo-inositol-1(or 4)-monophosphatase